MEVSLKKVLIANRGEVAVRIARAAAELDMRSVAVYARDDQDSVHRRHCDEDVELPGHGTAAYLDIESVVNAALRTGCDALHPGYGFLSENSALARRCAEAGLTFVGPSPEVLDLFGDKVAARRLADELEIPVPRGLFKPTSLAQAQAFMASLGAHGKIMVKAVSGGGGRGIRTADSPAALQEAYTSARTEAKAAFGLDNVYVEEMVNPARHIEVQVIGDTAGHVTHLYERECSLQRRRQKLVEFAPAPGIAPALRDRLTRAALSLARAARVHTLCTFEFLVDPQDRFVFIEANPRLQVEHTVTEEVTGIDLVKTQFQLAAGATLKSLRLEQADVPPMHGAAVQLRINMERIDEQGRALPSSGTLTAFDPPGGAGVRLDTFAHTGYTPPSSFDSLLAKLVVHVPSGHHAELLRRAYRALCEFRIEGLDTSIGTLQNLLTHPDIEAGRLHTLFIETQGARLFQPTDRHPRRHAAPARSTTPAPGNDQPAHSPDSPAGCIALGTPMGGRLVRLLASAADEVRAGQPIAVIEAMKMEHTVTADETGLVHSLVAAPGDSLTPGAALLFLEPRSLSGHGQAADAGAQDHDDAAQQQLEALVRRQEALLDVNRPHAKDKQRARGALTARERIALLSDAHSFVEIGGLIHNEGGAEAPADGLVVGSARVDGRPVMVMAQDFSVFGGSTGPLGRLKMLKAMARSRTNGLPFVMLLDGGGHRIQDGQNSRHFAASTPAFQEFARLSGWVPVVAAVLGSGFAANTNNCGMADFVVMVRGKSEMGLAGPALVRAGTGEQISAQALGGADLQVDRYGLADLGVDSEEDAIASLRRFLSFLPSNAGLAAPRSAAFEGGDGAVLQALVPANTRKSYDMRRVVDTLADIGSCFEIKPTFGSNIVTTLARLAGQPVGFIANQPLVMGGMLDAAAAEKAAHFIALCDAYGLPLIYLIDIPGMSIGSQAERSLLGRRSAKLLFELGHATVPRMSVILRKGYGLGYVAMCGGRGFDADICLAWPTAEICAMSIEGSVDVAYRKQFVDAADPQQARQDIIDDIRSRVSALNAAEGFGIDDVIEPAQTRPQLIDALSQAPARRPSTMPPKIRSISPI